MYDNVTEAKRCIACKIPFCEKGCPVSTPIKEIIQMYLGNKILEAGDILFKNNPLSIVCSIVCPHEKQCQGNCVRGIKGNPVSIGEIEAYIFDEALKNEYYKNYKKGIK